MQTRLSHHELSRKPGDKEVTLRYPATFHGKGVERLFPVPIHRQRRFPRLSFGPVVTRSCNHFESHTRKAPCHHVLAHSLGSPLPHLYSIDPIKIPQ